MRAPILFFATFVVTSFLTMCIFLPFGYTNVESAGYDVSVANKDITYLPAAPYAGDTVEISVTVRNNGTTAENVAVAFYLGADPVDSEVKPVVPVSAVAKGQWDTTGLAPGSYKINITLVASGDTNASNNNASVSIVLVKRPEPIIIIESMQVSPVTPVDGKPAFINGTVRNDGDANASVEADFRVDNVSIGKTPLKLDFGTKKNVSYQWDTTGKEGAHQVAIVIGTVKRTSQVTVAHQPRATFEVVRVWLSDKRPYVGRQVRVYAEVKNTGDASDDIVVVFKDNVKTFAQSKPLVYAPGENHTVSATWTAKKGERVLRVEVTDHPEAFNFLTVKPQNQGGSACGFTIAPGLAVITCCACVATWGGARKGKRPA